MGQKERIARYRNQGGAADLVRVEVLVPAASREAILRSAERLRAKHRRDKQALEELLSDALARYGTRVADNVDLSRLPDLRERARVVGRALQERADAAGFSLGRRLLELSSEESDGTD